jgi:hypothetical protein
MLEMSVATVASIEPTVTSPRPGAERTGAWIIVIPRPAYERKAEVRQSERRVLLFHVGALP